MRPSRPPSAPAALVLLAALGAPSFAAVGCADDAAPTAPAVEPSGEESDLKATKPLTAKSFAEPLTKAGLRASNDDLGDALFETKWSATLIDSAVMFARAYPGAFHADLAQVDRASLPGKETLCFGDAHPDNFGFLRLDDATRYLYNDLDDAGFCTASVDALRYFAILRLYFGDDALTEQTLEAYVDGLKEAGERAEIASSLSPSWSKVREKGLAKAVLDDAFIGGGDDGITEASAAEEKAVRAAVGQVPALSNAQILDVATLDRTTGGSGGLARYWILLNPSPGGNGPKKTIYELKELATPGTERGRSTETLDPATRLAELKDVLWSTDTQSDYLELSLLGKRFLLRDRLAKKSVDLEELSKGDLRDVLAVQAGRLAARHEAAFAGVKKDDLRPWLLASSAVVAARWQAFFDASRGARLSFSGSLRPLCVDARWQPPKGICAIIRDCVRLSTSVDRNRRARDARVMTALRRLFPLFGSLALVSIAACGDDATAPAPVPAAGAGNGGSGGGPAGASGTSAGGTQAGGAGAGGASGAGAGGGAGNASAGSAGVTAAGSGGTAAGGAAGQSPTGACKVDTDCPQPTTTFPADCAEGYCGTDQKCRFRAKDEDGDSHRKKTCQSLAGAPIELGQDCNDGDENTHPGAWDGPADGPLPGRCNDGVDQDCSGVADDGVATTGATCVCVPADTRPCSEDANGNAVAWPKLDAAGLPIGECKRGSQICTPQGKWGVCTGIKAPLKELCDDKDNDCDGEVDEGPPTDAPYWLYDGDKDLHAAAGYQPVQRCTPPIAAPVECATCLGVDAAGKSLWRTNLPDDDCNDKDNGIKPGQAEVCNGDGVDHNCDGLANQPDAALLQCDCTNGDVADCAREGQAYPGDKPTDGYPLQSGPALSGVCAWGKKQCIAGKWGICTGGQGRAAEEEKCVDDGLDYDCDGATNKQECACGVGAKKKCGNCDLGESTCAADGSWGACNYAGDPRGEYCEDKDGDGVCGPCTANVCPVDVAGRKLESACAKRNGVRAVDCDDSPATGAPLGANADGACRVCAPGAGASAALQEAAAPGGSWDWNCDGTVTYSTANVIEIPDSFGSMNGSSAGDKAIVADFCLSRAQGACSTPTTLFTTRSYDGPGDDGICGRPYVRGSCTYQPAQGKCLADAGNDAQDFLKCRLASLTEPPLSECRKLSVHLSSERRGHLAVR